MQGSRWLRRALNDLNAEAEFLAASDPERASAFVATVVEAVRRLTVQPGLGRPGRLPGTRELVLSGWPYIIPYRVREDVVEVLRVFHTSRRPPGRW